MVQGWVFLKGGKGAGSCLNEVFQRNHSYIYNRDNFTVKTMSYL